MDASITPSSNTTRPTRAEHCKKMAQGKSHSKREAAFNALALLKKHGKPITKAAVAKQAGVSVPFLRAHPDLIGAIEQAESDRTRTPIITNTEARQAKAQSHLVAALQRRMNQMKAEIDRKDAQLRKQKLEIDTLFGKLSESTDSQKLKERLQMYRGIEDENVELRKEKDRYFKLASQYKTELEAMRESRRS